MEVQVVGMLVRPRGDLTDENQDMVEHVDE